MTTPTTNIIVPLQGKVTTRSGAGGEMAAKTVQKGASKCQKQPRRSEEGERRRSMGPPWSLPARSRWAHYPTTRMGHRPRTPWRRNKTASCLQGTTRSVAGREETRDGGAVLAPSVTVAWVLGGFQHRMAQIEDKCKTKLAVWSYL